MSAPRRCALVRHADARARRTWTAPDLERPLTDKGERQADVLAKALGALEPHRILTSPAKRCADTLAPLALALGLGLEHEPLLGEGSPPEVALHLLLEATGEPGARGAGIVACSHGDVVDGIVNLLAADGVALAAEAAHTPVLLHTPKGGRWELEVSGGAVTSARLVGPPEPVRSR